MWIPWRKNKKLFLIVGLGNPGKKYIRSRHNAGFMAVDFLHKNWGCADFVFHKKFNADICDQKRNDQKIFFAKPRIFMNNSGQSVRALADFYKIPIHHIIVLHDELDLPLGEYKIATDSRAAGHNGVQDLFDRFGTKKITRVRMGVDARDDNQRQHLSGREYVLQNFSGEELKKLEGLFPALEEDVRTFLQSHKK